MPGIGLGISKVIQRNRAALELTFTAIPEPADTYEGIMTASYVDLGGGVAVTGYSEILGMGSMTPAPEVLNGFDNACNLLVWNTSEGGAILAGYTLNGVDLFPIAAYIEINDTLYDLGGFYISMAENPFEAGKTYNIKLYAAAPISDVRYWNLFFNLPANGTPFASVEIVGNTVKLYGGSEISIGNSFFTDDHLISFVDNTGCIKSVGNWFFNSNIYIENVKLPNLVTAGNYFIHNCTSLNSVLLPKIETIGDYSLSANLLASVSLPSLITAGEEFLNGCELLTEVTLPLLTSCGNYSLQNCILLTDIELPELVIAYHDLLYGSGLLSSVSLPKLKSAGHALCYGCNSLLSASFPLLESCEAHSFDNCNRLTTLNLSSVSDLGGTVGDDSCFTDIIGQTITITIPVALMTCNEGNPDGDIAYLIANNTVTVIQV